MQFSIIVNIKLFEVFKTILNDKMVFFSAFFHFTLSVYWKNETNTEEQNFIILKIGLLCVSDHVKQLELFM